MSESNLSVFIPEGHGIWFHVDTDVEIQLMAAVEESSGVVIVNDARENETAAAVQTNLATLIKAVEVSRVAAVKPANDYVKSVNDKAKELKLELQREHSRIDRMVGEFVMHQRAIAKAAESARLTELDEAERQRQEAKAHSKSIDELDAIDEAFNNKAAVAASKPIPTEVRAEGQVIRDEWEIEINPTLLMGLAARYPHCVKIEARLAEIKSLLAAGVLPATLAPLGVTAVLRPRTVHRMKRKEVIEV